jgi:phosphate transport system protein
MDKPERHFDKELADLKKKLLTMAAIAEGMIDQEISAMINRVERLAEGVPQSEEDLNRLQIEIDEEVLRLLATRQPVASDLRFLLAATRINGELERIGDLVINISENTHILAQQEPLKPLIDIPRMAELARQMVRESLDAFVKADPLLAQAVIMMDDQVDALKDQVLRELLTYMMGDPRTIERAIALILIARHLERIGDHAVNIAEDVIYMIQGRDVRHPRTPRERPAAEPEGGTRASLS